MKKKISRCLTVIVLCFSCILLFKSGNIMADEAVLEGECGQEAGYDRSRPEEKECSCSCGWRGLRLYLDEKSYITLDVALLVTVMVFAFVLVLEKVCGR